MECSGETMILLFLITVIFDFLRTSFLLIVIDQVQHFIIYSFWTLLVFITLEKLAFVLFLGMKYVRLRVVSLRGDSVTDESIKVADI